MGQSTPIEPSMAERASPQARVNTRALEIVAELRGDLAGHKDMDALQFANVRTELTEIKGDIKQLNDDAKHEIGEVKKQQGSNHIDNQSWMRRLEEKVDVIGQKQTSDDGKREGARLLGLTIKDWVIVALGAVSLIFNFTHQAHP